MKYALVNGEKTEAIKGSKGICPCCGSALIAKCGEQRINHWAHKGKRDCDVWWESETAWHRSWKNNFRPEWQEFILTDEQTNEKHIADVHTSYGLTIEFQHSHIHSQERISRENFYPNMVWVVDGTRLKRDYPRFVKARKYLRRAGSPHIFIGLDINDSFPSAWVSSTVPVIFDFQSVGSIDNEISRKKYLYCLFPNYIGAERVFAEISRQAFILNVKNGQWTQRARNLMDKIDQFNHELEKPGAPILEIRKNISFN